MGLTTFSKDLWGWTQTLCFHTIDRHKEEEAFCLKAKVRKSSQEKEYLWYLIPTLYVKGYRMIKYNTSYNIKQDTASIHMF